MITEIEKPLEIERLLEVSCLKPESTEKDIIKLCEEALTYHFGVVFAMSSWLPLTSKLLKGSEVRIGASIAFPLGSHSTFVKIAETIDGLAMGAEEIDMQMNIGALKSGFYTKVEKDIVAVVEAAHGHTVKVIIETGLLKKQEKKVASQIVQQAGAQFVKTCSGFAKGSASVEDILLIREVVGPDMGVKASGGIRTYQQALQLIKAGANGIGTSTGAAIAEEARRLNTIQ